MKMTFLIFLLASSSMVFADDSSNLLRNGDFSDGLAEWEGDCHTPGSASDDSGATSGAVVKLRHTDWTKMTQDFPAKAGRYILTVKYTVTPNLTFSANRDDYTTVPEKLDFGALRNFNSHPGQWLIIVNDRGSNWFHWWEISPSLDADGVQTIRRQVELQADSDGDGFYLCFPPGDGTINVQSITMASMDH